MKVYGEASEKQPWELTYNAYKKRGEKYIAEAFGKPAREAYKEYMKGRVGPGAVPYEVFIHGDKETHRESVKKAFDQNKNIPIEVLQDYPDLLGRYYYENKMKVTNSKTADAVLNYVMEKDVRDVNFSVLGNANKGMIDKYKKYIDKFDQKTNPESEVRKSDAVSKEIKKIRSKESKTVPKTEIGQHGEIENAKQEFLRLTKIKERTEFLEEKDLTLLELGELPIYDKRLMKRKKKPDPEKLLLKNNVSENELRPVMQGVYHDKNGNLVATDGYQLLIVKKASNKSGNIRSEEYDKVEGQYPDYEKVLSDKTVNIGTYSVEDMLRVTKQAKKYKLSKNSNGICYPTVKIGDRHFYTNNVGNLARSLWNLGVKEVIISEEPDTRLDLLQGIQLKGKGFYDIKAKLMPVEIKDRHKYNYELRPKDTSVSDKKSTIKDFGLIERRT